MRSSAFSGVRVSTAMQVTDASRAWRTRIPRPENQKVDGSTRPYRRVVNAHTAVVASATYTVENLAVRLRLLLVLKRIRAHPRNPR